MTGRIFLTSDTHFSHKNIIRYCNRPYADVSYMNQGMIDAWNSVVNDGDIVYHLGDFSMHEKSVKHYLDRLYGIKVLIRGNHDENSILHEFDGYAHRMIMNHKGLVFEMVHDPSHLSGKIDYAFCGHVHDSWKRVEKGYEQVDKQRGNISYGIIEATTLNVGVDVHEMKPILLDDAIEMLIDRSNKR